MADRDDLATGINRETPGARDWASEEQYWLGNFTMRPYASADRGFEYYRPGYRYGYESASRLGGRRWDEVEGDLRSGWDRYEHRGQSTWENVKDAVRDAWDRVTGHGRDASAGRSDARTTY